MKNSNNTTGSGSARAHLIRNGVVNPQTGKADIGKMARTGIAVPNKPTTGSKSGGRKGK